MLVAIVSRNVLLLVFVRYHAVVVLYVAKWGIAQMCLCKPKYQGGASHNLSGSSCNLPDKLGRDMRYCSDSMAISRDLGPLRWGVCA